MEVTINGRAYRPPTAADRQDPAHRRSVIEMKMARARAARQYGPRKADRDRAAEVLAFCEAELAKLEREEGQA